MAISPPSFSGEKTYAQMAADANAYINSSNNPSGITTVAQAKAFVNSDLGKSLPYLSNYINTIDSIKKNDDYAKAQTANAIAQIAFAASNPTDYALYNLNKASSAFTYGKARNLNNWVSDGQKNLGLAANYLISQGVSAPEIYSQIEAGQQAGLKSANSDVSRLGKGNFLDKTLDVFDIVAGASVASAMGLGPVGAAALNSAMAISNGANVTEALKAAIGGLTAAQVPEFLKSVNAISGNQIVDAAVNSATQNIANAAITGQDIKTAALAGLVGGGITGAFKAATSSSTPSTAAQPSQPSTQSSSQTPTSTGGALGSGFYGTSDDEIAKLLNTPVAPSPSGQYVPRTSPTSLEGFYTPTGFDTLPALGSTVAGGASGQLGSGFYGTGTIDIGGLMGLAPNGQLVNPLTGQLSPVYSGGYTAASDQGMTPADYIQKMVSLLKTSGNASTKTPTATTATQKPSQVQTTQNFMNNPQFIVGKPIDPENSGPFLGLQTFQTSSPLDSLVKALKG